MADPTMGAGLVPMSDEARGHAIKRRRLAAGLKSLEDFAAATGLARQTISRAERGHPTTTATTYERLEMWLDNFERETDTATQEAAIPQSAETDTVEFRLQGNFGVDVIVKGPVANLPELEAAVARLLGRMHD